jgi:hypothetical protein
MLLQIVESVVSDGMNETKPDETLSYKETYVLPVLSPELSLYDEFTFMQILNTPFVLNTPSK